MFSFACSVPVVENGPVGLMGKISRIQWWVRFPCALHAHCDPVSSSPSDDSPPEALIPWKHHQNLSAPNFQHSSRQQAGINLLLKPNTQAKCRAFEPPSAHGMDEMDELDRLDVRDVSVLLRLNLKDLRERGYRAESERVRTRWVLCQRTRRGEGVYSTRAPQLHLG